ncbi:MAG: diacylglycerol kinase [Bacteroidota bacterium]
MDISHSDFAIQARSSSPQNVSNGLRKVFMNDAELHVQLFFTIPIVAGGIILHLNAVQWFLVSLVTLLFLVVGIFRTASMLQIKNNSSLSTFQVTRIKAMGNTLVTLTAGISFFTYLLVFVPKIIQLL